MLDGVLVPPTRTRLRVEVRGLVQGVGFRPFVHALAHRLGLSGFVANTADGVLVEVEGAAETTSTRSPAAVRDDAPVLADVRRRWSRPTSSPPAAPASRSGTPSSGPGPHLRLTRRRHLRGLPRATCPTPATGVTGTRSSPAPTAARGSRSSPVSRTTVRPPRWPGSRCVPACAREYADPSDRRFHAQPICCPDCGPRLAAAPVGEADLAGEDARADAARRLLREGRGRSRSRDSAATTSPATPRHRRAGGDCCASASDAGTSRSR